MAMMILTYRIMPKDGDVEYSQLEDETIKVLKDFDKSVKINSTNKHNVGFGLQAVKVNFSIDEKCGSEAVEEKLKGLKIVGDVIIESMSRAMG